MAGPLAGKWQPNGDHLARPQNPIDHASHCAEKGTRKYKYTNKYKLTNSSLWSGATVLVQNIMVNNCERVDWGWAIWREHCKRWFSLEPAVPLSVTGGWLAVVIQYGTGDTVATWLLTNPKIQHGTKHHRLISTFSSNNFKWSDKTKAIDQTWMSTRYLSAARVQQNMKRKWQELRCCEIQTRRSKLKPCQSCIRFTSASQKEEPFVPSYSKHSTIHCGSIRAEWILFFCISFDFLNMLPLWTSRNLCCVIRSWRRWVGNLILDAFGRDSTLLHMLHFSVHLLDGNLASWRLGIIRLHTSSDWVVSQITAGQHHSLMLATKH